MVTRDELYKAVGEFAVAFSNLEHNVVRILDVLAGGATFLGPILLDDLSISRVLGYMRTYIKAHLRQNDELRERVEKLVKEVDQTRIDRNLIIHGKWATDDRMLEGGRISCFEYKLRYDKDTNLWEYLHDHKFTLDQLAVKTVKILSLCDDAMQLGKDVEAYLNQRK